MSRGGVWLPAAPRPAFYPPARSPAMSLRRLPLETHRPPGGTLLGRERCSAQGAAVTEPSVRPRPQGLWSALPRVFPHQAAAPPHGRPLCDVMGAVTSLCRLRSSRHLLLAVASFVGLRGPQQTRPRRAGFQGPSAWAKHSLILI